MKAAIWRFGFTGFAAPLALLAVPVSAQDAVVVPDTDLPHEAAAPIVVQGEAAEKKEVLVGSRIPQRAIFTDGIVATSLGTRGLVPQSGMDQGANVRTIKRAECKSDSPAIGKAAACLLIEAKTAIEVENFAEADSVLSYLALSDDFTPQERLAGAQWRYRLAGEQGDAYNREDALEQMVETGAMNPAQEAQARRSLATMAQRDGRQLTAQQRLLALDAIGQAQTQDLANLAILTRALKLPDAEAYMIRAIAKREEGGGKAPKGWRDFVGANL